MPPPEPLWSCRMNPAGDLPSITFLPPAPTPQPPSQPVPMPGTGRRTSNHLHLEICPWKSAWVHTTGVSVVFLGHSRLFQVTFWKSTFFTGGGRVRTNAESSYWNGLENIRKSIFSGVFFFLNSSFLCVAPLPGQNAPVLRRSPLSCTFPQYLLSLYLMVLFLFLFLENERRAGDIIFINFFLFLLFIASDRASLSSFSLNPLPIFFFLIYFTLLRSWRWPFLKLLPLK